MKSTNKIPLVIGIVVLISAVSLYIIFNSEKEVNWSERYLPEEKMPYDTYIIEQLLRNNAQGKEFKTITDSTHLHLTKEEKNEMLVYIGSTFFYDEKDLQAIREFVNAGNTFFLSTENLDRNLLDSLYYYDHQSEFQTKAFDPIYDEYIYSDDPEHTGYIHSNAYDHPVFESPIMLSDYSSLGIEMKLNDSQNKTSLYYVYDFDTISTLWSYFNPTWINHYSTEKITSKGSFRSKGSIASWEAYSNFIEIKHGKGKILFHLHPKVFTNYFLKEESAFRYASEIFNDINVSKIIWAEENRRYDYIKQLNENEYSSAPDDSFMEFILSEPPLRYAWYTMVLAVFLYLVFGAKRKQRVIPVLEKKSNTSIEYAEVLAQLFLEEDDHSKLISMKKELFRSFLRDRYGIKAPVNYKQIDESFLQHLHLKSGIAITEIKELFDNWFHIEAIGIVYTNDMLEFNKKLESFYKKSK